MTLTTLHHAVVGAQERVARLTLSRRHRVLATRWALWILGASLVTVAYWPTLSVPTQADDLLTLFNIGAHHDGSLAGEMANVARSSFRSFRDGTSAHFYPLGAAMEIGLKRTMLRGSSLHLTASSVHHAAFLLITLGTFVAAVVLVFRLRGAASPSRFGAAAYAVPVALGFAACLQVTTPWSTYDPVVVHPVFGAFVTFIGIAYLAVFVDVLRGDGRVRTTVLCAVLGLLGMMTYEGFFPFVGIALVMIVVGAVRHRLGGGSWSINAAAVWAAAPALALILATRLYAGRHPGAGDYRGTAVTLKLDTVTAWWTSVHTTSPAGAWGRDVSTNHPALAGGHSPRVLALAFIVVAAVVWAFVARYIDRPSPAVGVDPPVDPPLATPVAAALADRVEPSPTTWWLPPAAMIVLCPAIFAASVQWSAYLNQPGNTYMNATSAYWAWSMLAGVVLLHLVSRHRSKWIAFGAVAAALAWSGVQTTINASAVRTEVASPTPFGFDLVRMLDDGTDLDSAGRCRLLEMIPQVQARPDWQVTINELYLDRHGEPFC